MREATASPSAGVKGSEDRSSPCCCAHAALGKGSAPCASRPCCEVHPPGPGRAIPRPPRMGRASRARFRLVDVAGNGPDSQELLPSLRVRESWQEEVREARRGAAVLGAILTAGGKLAGMGCSAAWGCAALVLVHTAPACAHVVGALALWSKPTLLGMRIPWGGRAGLGLLRPLRGPMLGLGAARAVLPLAAPSLWRSLRYWRRIVPIFSRYLWTKFRATRLERRGKLERAAELWEERHRDGAEEIYSMLEDLRGFYLKLGQIIATKTDMLGPVYTEVLGRLHDKMPYVPVKQVRKLLRKEFNRPSKRIFKWLDDVPLASATIAQVHRARLRDGQKVVVKVQHRGVERMMRSDLRNMRLFLEILRISPLDIGFDVLSIIREYQEVVPYEFDFAREGCMQALLRKHLAESGYGPLVVVPSVIPSLTTKKVLVMEYLDGVPVLDIQHLSQDLDKAELMTKLLRSFGLMILRDGVFHTDPHPGNLLAMYNRSNNQPAIALLDFGQVKELSAEGQEDFAKLVVAMAARDSDKVRSVMAEVGLDIRGCSEEFRALAGYILFDTRMDFAEAWMSPFEAAAHEFRATIVKVFPQELFMIMRVITLFRGILASLEVDVSSSLLWRDLAEDVLAGRGGVRAIRKPQAADGGPLAASARARPRVLPEGLSASTNKNACAVAKNAEAYDREEASSSAVPGRKQATDSTPPGASKGVPMPEAEAQQNRQPHRAALSPTAGRAQSASQPQTPEATIGGVEESWRYEEVPEASLSPSPDPPGSPTPSTQLHPDGGSQGDTARGFQDMMAITCTSLENLRKMLSQSRRGSEDGGGAIHLGNSLDSVVAAMPKLRSIRTAPIDSPPMHEGPADDAEDCSFNLQLRPFANTWDTTSVQPEASPREQLKTSHCTSGFTFSPASKPDRATLLQTWSIGSNRTHSDSSHQVGTSRSGSSDVGMSRLRNPTSIESIPDGATLVHKEMNAGYGAPPMKFTVKLTDV